MDNVEQLQRFLDEYKSYAETVLAPTREELRALLKEWQEPAYWAAKAARSRLPAPSPIQSTKTRIKRPESVVDKIFRHRDLYPDGLAKDSIQRMWDVVGGRIIVYFLANMPLIDHELRSSARLELHPETPAVAYLGRELYGGLALDRMDRRDKESGYASIHYYVRFRDSKVPKDQRPWFEVQLRTLAQHCWGEVEHVLGYKPNKRTSLAVRRQFQIISKQLEAADQHFNFLHDELARFQEEVTYNDNDPLNAENLPAVLSEIGVGCVQREIDGLLKILISRGLGNIGSLREVATTKSMEVIRNVFRAREGYQPGNFEIVAALAAIRGLTTEEEMTAAIETQIQFLKAWEEFKKFE